jgi:fatty acid desaturase
MVETEISLKVISRAETLRHNTINDCWLIIHNYIYDLTEFIKLHPGGSEILLTRAGEDATSFFISKHGKNRGVIKQLEGMKIGVLPEAEQVPMDDFKESFFMDLIDKCYKNKLYTVPSLLKNELFYIRLINLIVFFTCSILALYGRLPFWVALLLVVIQGIVGTSLFGFVAHENTHRNFPKNPILKGMLRVAWPVIWPFIAQKALAYEHNSHHIKIGDVNYDFEVAGFSSVIRYSGTVEVSKRHQSQHKFAKFIYPFYANIITTIGGAKSNFWSSHNRSMIWSHSLSLLWTFTFYVGLPTLVMGGGFLWFLFLYLIYQCVLFYGIYVGAAINHFVPQITEEIPEQFQNVFGYYVCHNTTNFCTDSPFWFWYSGGFNVQIEHHLVPFVPVENLRKMIPIVKELCQKYNYPYHNYKTVRDLWVAHYDYLAIMSDPNPNHPTLMEIANKKGYSAR